MEEEYHRKAIEAIDQGNYQKGLEYIEKALEISPYDPTFLTERGTLYLHLGERTKCLKDMDTVVNLEPKNGYRYSCRAYCRSFFKDIDGAVADYEVAVQLDPEDAIAYNNLGLLLERKGAMDRAKKNFNKADQISKENEEFKDFFDSRSEDEKKERENQFREEAKKAEAKRKEVNPILFEEETRSRSEIAKDIFRKKSTFREFVGFIKNGFKLKQDDQSRKS